jgi:tetratricopeptide (TPR) repeat protein
MRFSPGHADDYEAGMAAFNAGDYPQALAHLEQIADGNSLKGTLAAFYVGQAHLRLGMQRFNDQQFAAAATHFRHAEQANPVPGGLCRYLATCYSALGRTELAAAELEKAVNAEPNETDTRIRLALTAWKTGQAKRAVEILEDGLARRGDHAELACQLGTILAAEERYEEAAAALRRALDDDPDHLRALVRLGLCYGMLGRTDDAIDALQRAQQRDPNNGMIAYQLSLLHGRATTTRSRDPRASWRPPIVLDTDDTRAIERLAAMIEQDPEFVEAFLQLPESHVDGQLFAAVLRAIEKAIERRPAFADLRHHCSRVLARLGRVDQAIEQAERALAINNGYVQGLIQLAQLYQITDRAEIAVSRLRQALELGANYPDVHYNLGQLLQRLGRADEARSAYERALELNEHYAAARDALAAMAA